MTLSLQSRVIEIENLVAGNELNLATKRLMDFVTDFAIARRKKRDVINIRARYNNIREDMRRFGKSNETNERLSRLRYGILDFIETITEDYQEGSQESNLDDEKGAVSTPLSLDRKTGSHLQKTRYEQDKELFRKQRKQVSAPTDVIFYGKDITKTYKGRSIDFTLHIPELQLRLGEITALVGENGNGKTTLLRIIANRLQVTDGSLEYPALSSNEKTSHYSIKQQIAYIPQELPKWSGLLVDNLHFSASSHGVKGEKNIEEVDFIISRLGLDQYRDATWKEISGGYKMRFALAKALVWNPKFLILDEPLANLDVNTQLIFLQDLRYLADSIVNPKAIIVSSQHLHSIESISDNVVFIQDGKALYNGKLAEFGKDRESNSFEFTCDLSKEDLTDLLDTISWQNIEVNGNQYMVNTPTSVTANELLSLFIQHNVSVTYFRDISKSTRRLFKLER